MVVASGLYHDNTVLAYRDPSGAIQPTGSATLRLRTCQNDVQQVQVLVWRTGDPLASPSFTYPAAVASSDGTYSLWEATVPGDTVNLWYQFRVTDAPDRGPVQPRQRQHRPGQMVHRRAGQPVVEPAHARAHAHARRPTSPCRAGSRTR